MPDIIDPITGQRPLVGPQGNIMQRMFGVPETQLPQNVYEAATGAATNPTQRQPVTEDIFTQMPSLLLSQDRLGPISPVMNSEPWNAHAPQLAGQSLMQQIAAPAPTTATTAPSPSPRSPTTAAWDRGLAAGGVPIRPASSIGMAPGEGGTMMAPPGTESFNAMMAMNESRPPPSPYQQQMNLMQQMYEMADRNRPAFDTNTTEGRAALANFRSDAMRSILNHTAPGVMPNELGGRNLEFHREQEFGNPNNPARPGRQALEATDVQTRRLTAENARYAEDRAADQAAELAIKAHMTRYRITDEAEAVRQLMAADPAFRRPRRLGGGQTPSLPLTPGATVTPQTQGGQATPPTTQPAQPAVGAGTTQPPPLTAAQQAETIALNRRRDAIASAFQRGIMQVPEVTTVDQNNISRQVRRTPAEDRNAYMNAITHTLANLPDEAIRAEWNTPGGIRERLIEQSGDPAVLAEWQAQNYWTNPFTGNPLSSNPNSIATTRQLQRMVRLLREMNPQAPNPVGPTGPFGIPNPFPRMRPATGRPQGQ